MSIRRAMAIMPIMLVVLTACGTGGGPSTAGSDAAAPLTAEQVTSVLIGKIPTVKLVKAYTATDDPNHQLGRPNGYTSKTAFSDSRVPAGELEGQREDATERGGSVEVFADAASAKARMDYIQTIGKSLPLAVEYNYVNGPILVRVTNLLTPDQAKDYETATKELR